VWMGVGSGANRVQRLGGVKKIFDLGTIFWCLRHFLVFGDRKLGGVNENFRTKQGKTDVFPLLVSKKNANFQ
jgi:hypothetical protein